MKHKYCVIRKVPFKMPGPKSRVVWAHVLCEREGLALLLVPKLAREQAHMLFVATENVAEHMFEPVDQHGFQLEEEDVERVGLNLWVWVKALREKRMEALFNHEGLDSDEF